MQPHGRAQKGEGDNVPGKGGHHHNCGGQQGQQGGQKQDLKGLYVLAIYIDQRIHRRWPPLWFPLLQHAVQRFLEPHLGRGGAVCAAHPGLGLLGSELFQTGDAPLSHPQEIIRFARADQEEPLILSHRHLVQNCKHPLSQAAWTAALSPSGNIAGKQIGQHQDAQNCTDGPKHFRHWPAPVRDSPGWN